MAANLYERQGDASTYTDIPKLVAELVSKVSDEQVYADLDASLAWAARNGGDPARVAVTGFCWGGRLTWMYAAHNPAVKAGVAWYGKLSVGHGPLIKRYALDVAQDLRAPVLGLHGGRDASIPLADVDRMKAGLAAGSAARRSEIVVYPEADHGFLADYRPTTTPRPPRTAGAVCWTGSRTTSNSPQARTPSAGPRGAASPVRSGAPEGERVALGGGAYPSGPQRCLRGARSARGWVYPSTRRRLGSSSPWRASSR